MFPLICGIQNLKFKIKQKQGHECKRGTVWRKNQQRKGESKKG
jgi:CxxC motif-containing protein